MADSLTPRDLLSCGQKWLAYLTPFFKESERKQAGCQHRLFFSQVEYCDNLIFSTRAALDKLGERLLDANRTIGQPKKLTVIYGRKITRRHNGKLQTVIEDLNMPNSVMRSHYKNGYVPDIRMLRTEAASNNVNDYNLGKSVENLPQLRQTLQTITDTYLDIQQDILETFVDRGQLLTLREPTVLASSRRIPGLRPDNPRQLALMQALVRFSHIAAGSTFVTADLHTDIADAPGRTTTDYTLASLRYDLSKLLAKGLIEKLPKSRRYRLTSNGYQLCVVYLKLFRQVYAPLTSGILDPFQDDDRVADAKTTKLDRRYRAVGRTLDQLVVTVGLKAAA
jgi:hypothetical protein